MMVIVKSILVAVILCAMVLILLGINQHVVEDLFIDSDEDGIDKFHSDMETKDDVITTFNPFRRFFGR